MQVLEHHDQRTHLRQEVEQPSDGFEDAGAAQLRVEPVNHVVIRFDRQQRAQKLRRRAEAVAERLGCTGDPIIDRVVAVARLQGKRLREQVDQRMERQRPAERHGRSLKPCGARARSPAEFVEKAALADARIAGDEQSLPSPLLDLRQEIVEQCELALARHEWGRVLIGIRESHHPPRLKLRGRWGHWLEIEPPIEKRARGR